MNLNIYYRVSGQLPLWKRDGTSSLPVASATNPSLGKHDPYTRVGITPDQHVRFETLDVYDAQSFATDVYRREQILCVIDEITRP